jgi:hypothetical protein
MQKQDSLYNNNNNNNFINTQSYLIIIIIIILPTVIVSNMTLYCPKYEHRGFGGIFCLHFHGGSV